MVFDPASIKNRTYKPGELPEGASREQRIASLAEVLLERGLATNLAAAKRLAEGMVDTERKVLGQTPRPAEHAKERASFQSSDSPLFKAVGGVAELKLSPAFSEFIDRARRKSFKPAPMHTEQPRPVQVPAERPAQVMFSDPPARAEIREPYRKTQVEASPDGVVVRHVESLAREETILEEGIVRVPEEKPKKDPVKEQGVDLFDIFRTNK